MTPSLIILLAREGVQTYMLDLILDVRNVSIKQNSDL